LKKKTVDLSSCWRDLNDPDVYNISLSHRDYFQLVRELKANCSEETLNITKTTNFDQCLPVELIAYLNQEELLTTRFATKRKEDFATLELLRDYSIRDGLVINGFLTRLSYQSQKTILQRIPCLSDISFIRYGRMHENSFINAPAILDNFFSCKNDENLYIIGQLSGIDGYLPAVASAMVASYAIDCKSKGLSPKPFPISTMIGGFAEYISTKNTDYQPITSSFNLLPNTDGNLYENSMTSLTAFRDTSGLIVQ